MCGCISSVEILKLPYDRHGNGTIVSVLLVEETGENWHTLSHYNVPSTAHHERDSNTQRWWWYALITQIVVNPTTTRSQPWLSINNIYITTITTTCISEVIDYYIFNKNIYYFLEYKSRLLSCESLCTSYLNILFYWGLRI